MRADRAKSRYDGPMQQRSWPTGLSTALVPVLWVLVLAACGDERPAPPDTCEIDSDCLPGQTCVLGHCSTGRRDLGSPPPPRLDSGTDDATVDPDASVDEDAEMPDLGIEPICGDSIVDFPEDCDPPNPPTCEMRLGCSDTCTSARLADGCGNGCEEPGEECGDGSMTCEATADCVNCRCLERCGNGAEDAGEECGEPGLAMCAMGMQCRDCLCYMPECANGIVDEGEECNEPGLACPMDDACVDCACVPAGCGNGIADPGEECGEVVFADCPANHNCTNCACVRIPMCGDGAPDPGEECGEPDGPLCAAGFTCVDCGCVRTCGDGEAGEGEVCGEPVLPGCPAGSSCADCQCSGRCGNGIAELGEKCGEPGLTCSAGSACDVASCTCLPTCGNGTVGPGETCDPPATTAPLCAEPSFCNAYCETTLRPLTCGNGCIDPGEDCGDGGPSACDVGQICAGCRCIDATCGDGTLDAGEVCDGAALGTAECPDAPDGSPGGGTIACGMDCRPDISGCRCGRTSYTVTGTVLPIRRRDVWLVEADAGTRFTYRVDTTGTSSFDPVACVSTTPSSADCFSRSDDAFECTVDSGCGDTGCPQGVVTLPADPDHRYYVIVESYFCGACFTQSTGGDYELTVGGSIGFCEPTLTAEDDVCAGSGLVVPSQERCTCTP